ncbi:hypothetical protein [Clostridium cadaveris]
MRKNKSIILFMIFILALTFSGCSKIDNLKIKMGLKNNDFEYISENKIEKIVIQSTRDEGFRCVVTDKKTINNIHDILSSAKAVEGKTDLDSDYIFEIYEWGKEPHRFNYVVGVQDKKMGNFYNDNESYVVSKRIDNDIIRNLSVLRKPRDFSVLYYRMIMQFLDENKYLFENSSNIGINIKDDIEVAKYILSIDVENFKDDLKAEFPNAELVKDNKEEFDTVVNIKTYGYKEKVYKCIITVKYKGSNKESKFYALCQVEDNSWNIQISDKKQDDF